MATLANHDRSLDTQRSSADIDLAERIESIKAGLLGGVAAGLSFGALTLMHGWMLAPRFSQLGQLLIKADSLRWVVSGAIAALSGFLFGITYRYIIRQDQNSHLKAGAVLAFGLVRGLAQIDGMIVPMVPTSVLPLSILGVESLLLFASARIVLDWAIAQGWLKPFGANSRSE